MNGILKYTPSMNSNHFNALILGISYFLNIQVWIGSFSMWVKIGLAVLAGITTIMAFLNQLVTFRKNYKTTWIFIQITHVFKFIMPKNLFSNRRKKLRSKNRGNNPTKPIKNMSCLLLVSILDKSKIEYYFGTDDFNLIFSCFVFGCIGMIIMILLDVMSRDKTSAWSPVQFSWGFFWKDNAPRFLLNFILMLVAIRFLPEMIHQPVNQFHSLLVGIGSDQIAIIVRNKKKKFSDGLSTDQDATLQQLASKNKGTNIES